MKKFKTVILRYKYFLGFLVVNLLLLIFAPEIGKSSFKMSVENFLEMLTVVPAVFIMIGLLDVWVQRETMMKYMGEGSGVKGAVIAFLMGSCAAGPLYASFPVAAMLLKKGVKLSNIFIFVGAWSTTKIPLILFEATNLGTSYMLLRLGCNIVGIAIIALLLEKNTSEKEKEQIYERAKTL